MSSVDSSSNDGAHVMTRHALGALAHVRRQVVVRRVAERPALAATAVRHDGDRRLGRVRHGAADAGRDDGDADLVGHLRIDHVADDDRGVFGRRTA